MHLKKDPRKIILILFITFNCLFSDVAKCQTHGAFQPFTKWYQDPLGFRPLELSTAFGFVWGSVAVAASVIFTKKDSSLHEKISPYFETGFTVGYKWPYTAAFQNDVGFMYDIRKWMSVGMGLNAFHFKDKVNNTWCFG